jgi:hypothetical protein
MQLQRHLWWGPAQLAAQQSLLHCQQLVQQQLVSCPVSWQQQQEAGVAVQQLTCLLHWLQQV